jgi:hypothetical protein
MKALTQAREDAERSTADNRQQAAQMQELVRRTPFQQDPYDFVERVAETNVKSQRGR